MSRWRPKLGAAILVALACLGLTGCWDELPIEGAAFVSMVAFDGKPGHLTAYAEPVVPTNLPGGAGSSGSGKGPTFSVNQGEGVDAYGAIRAAQATSSKRLSLGQLEVVVVSDRAVAAGALPGILDYFMRGEKTRSVPWLYIVPHASLVRVLNTQPKQNAYPAQAVVYDSLQQQQLAEVFATRVFRVYANLIGGGQDAAIPVMSAEGDHFVFPSTALLHGDHLAGYVSGEDNRTLALLLGTSGQVPVTLKCPSGGTLSVETTSARVRLGANGTDGRLASLRVSLEGTIRLTNASSCPELLRQSTGTKALVDPAATAIARELERTIAQTQRLDSDVLGFGTYLHAYHPGLWRSVATDWHATYRRTPVEVQVRIQPNSTGLVSG